MPPVLKLVSLNIEHSKHLDKVPAFLEKAKPDVACIQELFERDIPAISKALGGTAHVYVPMTRHVKEHPPQIMGIAIFSRFPIKESAAKYYAGDPARVPAFDWADPQTFQLKNHMLLFCDIEKEGILFRISTTHFTWTPDGEPDALQRRDVKNLMDILDNLGEFVLCGDFNAPRGGEIFDVLAEKYTDNIPRHYTTSLDLSLHRAGKTRPEELANKMVDGIFSTPAYIVSDVELVSGVSDHCALVGNVSRSF